MVLVLLAIEFKAAFSVAVFIFVGWGRISVPAPSSSTKLFFFFNQLHNAQTDFFSLFFSTQTIQLFQFKQTTSSSCSIASNY